jgi:hypothetical protein
MRQFMMTVIALMTCAATAATAQAEKQTARPSQAVSAATVYCTSGWIGGRPAARQCYDNSSECARALGWYYGSNPGDCWPYSPTTRPGTRAVELAIKRDQELSPSQTALASSAPATCTGGKLRCLSTQPYVLWGHPSAYAPYTFIQSSIEQNRPEAENFCNFYWNHCMKTGFWFGHRAERR